MNQPVVYWFRRDLRLCDNTALIKAIETDRPIICLYIYDDNLDNSWNIGSASKWWLNHSLIALSLSLKKIGAKLILRKGNTICVLEDVIKESNSAALYFSRLYEPDQIAIENLINEKLACKIDIRRYKSYLLFEPEKISTGKNEPYKVFTPFYKACMRELSVSKPLPAPTNILAYKKRIISDRLSDWNLCPERPDWATGFNDYWIPGEAGAHQNLDDFIQHSASKYENLRNRPDVTGTSRLSPHLHFGEISPRQIWTAISHSKKDTSKGGECYLREIIWREFSYHLLFHWPSFPDSPFRNEFAKFPWKQNKKALIAWQKGRTGYPIVDAGMRELWATGWMHNRVRMIVASFLIKHLLITWQQGEAWFWDTLVDANLASNSASWQWVAGCGADASPYFRIFNPILQGEKFDPQGDYVRQWVPELQHLPVKFIHTPWQAPQEILNEANVSLGEDYPEPIIDHKFARDRALSAYKKIRNKH